MPYNTNKDTKQLWAVVDKETRSIKWTRGGSSASPKLMVYDKRTTAERALKNVWTKQVIRDSASVEIQLIYNSGENNYQLM